MGFEICPAGEFAAVEALGEGEVSLTKRGVATLRTDDLAAVGIDGYAVVLGDPVAMKVALRAPANKDERLQSVRVGDVSAGKGRVNAARKRVNLMPALRRLGIKADAVAGRYELRTQDSLLIIPLSELSAAEVAAAR